MTESSQIDCALCRANNLLRVPVIAEADGGYIINVFSYTDYYLIIPDKHIEHLQDLPDNWWHNVKTLLAHVPTPMADYNLSLNIGQNAGQTVPHVHFWVIPRQAGQASSGLGLAGLIAKINSWS